VLKYPITGCFAGPGVMKDPDSHLLPTYFVLSTHRVTVLAGELLLSTNTLLLTSLFLENIQVFCVFCFTNVEL